MSSIKHLPMRDSGNVLILSDTQALLVLLIRGGLFWLVVLATVHEACYILSPKFPFNFLWNSSLFSLPFYLFFFLGIVKIPFPA